MEDKVILQKDLDSLFEWGKIWGLKFNVSKCNILHLLGKLPSLLGSTH